MTIVLSERKLCPGVLPEDVKVCQINQKSLTRFDHSPEVMAIVASRATARIAAGMDLPNLKLCQLTSAGFDGVPIADFSLKKVAVANAGGVYSVPIAETVVFGMLTVAKKLRPNPNDRRVKWRRHYAEITELYEKKVLILGAGNIGTAVAERLAGFEMTLDGFARTREEKPPFRRMLRTRKEVLEALPDYDYVISALPDSDSTRRFIDGELIEKLKSTAVFVNVGRRAVIDEDALYCALKEKKLGGAVLDMFELIPNPFQNRFRRLKNVVVLPGVAAISREVGVRLDELLTNNVRAAILGEPIAYTL